MTDPVAIVWWGMLLVGFAGSATFSGIETGVYTLNRVRLHLLAARGVPAALRLRPMIDRPTSLLSTLLIGNNTANYLGTFALAVLLERAGVGVWQAVLLNVVIVTPALLIFGETLPKDLFAAHSDALLYRLAGFIRVSKSVLTWVGLVPVVSGFGSLIDRRLGGAGDAAVVHPRRQVQALVREGAGHGVLSPEQSDLLERVFTAEGRQLRDEMVPWDRVETVRVDAALPELRAVAGGTARSRLPVVDAQGRVCGVVDVFTVLTTEAPDATTAEQLAGPAPTLEAGLSVYQAIAEFQKHRLGLAVVRDGEEPLGVVTMKDLVETLTGELARW